MARLTSSAKWFLFAVKADDRRRAAYGKWLDRVHQREIATRRAALAELTATGNDIPLGVGHRSFGETTFGDAPDVVADVHRRRATARPARDAKPYLVDYPVIVDDPTSPLLRFALSDDVLAPAARYLGMVPILAMITILESSPTSDSVRAGSQLFHCDWEDRRQVKVFVHCSDIAPENGPLSALSADASARVKQAVGYHYGGAHFRLTDDEVLPRAHEDATAFVGPANSVTFIDTSSCLHFGSRMQPGAADRRVVQFQFLTPSAFDLQLAGRGGRPFAQLDGDFTRAQTLALGR